ncbi:MAG: hypothetical protein GX442_08375 [Candidatus Riflebacteria bacterium]|nr:hypothetical protein [Candidatus Riflebacteria bacterium]
MEGKHLVRWFVVVALVAVFVGGGLSDGGHPAMVRGEENDPTDNEAVGATGDSAGGDESVADEKPDDPAGEEAATVNEDADEEDDAEENGEAGKTFTCSRCGFSTDQAGDCPACNLPLTEVAAGSVETKGGAVRAESGEDRAEIEADGDVKAVSGKKSAEVSSDGSVNADDGTGNSVNIKAGGQVDLKSGDLHLNSGGVPGGY